VGFHFSKNIEGFRRNNKPDENDDIIYPFEKVK
jgi:hypothetical protein